MTDWDLLTPGIGLTSIGIVGVGISLAGVAKTFIDGMHAVSLLTMFIGMMLLIPGLFKDGFPMSGKAKSATFITLGFLVTFGFAAAVTVSAQITSIYAYIGLMMIISIPAAVLAVASYRRTPHLKALAIIFIGAAVVGGSTFYAFGLVAPQPVTPVEEEQPEGEGPATGGETVPATIINATILPGASAAGNPDYDPENLSVPRGAGVEWTNNDNTLHTVTSRADDGKTFDSSTIRAGAKYLLDTSSLAEGGYEYFCTLHPTMVAMLTVTAPAGGSQAPQAEENATAPPGGSASESSPGVQVGTPATVTTVSMVLGASTPTNNEFFAPGNVETTVGSMVTWRNDDTALHTATSGNPETVEPDGVFDSGFMKKDQTFSFVFDKTGEYGYYCALHPFMTGTVTVR